MIALYVAIGAVVGAPARFLIDQYSRQFFKEPFGIMLVNVLGSFIIGLTVGAPVSVQALVAIGFAGAFTTWSTFILDLYLAYKLRRYKSATINLALSLTLGISAAWIGAKFVQ